MRNYCGLVLTVNQYTRHGTTIDNKNVFNYGRESESIREKLWFAMGYEASFLIVVDRDLVMIETAIQCGLLYDCRKIPTDSWDASTFYDFAQNVIYGNVERIRLCNLVRDKLSTLQRLRWCGAELESIFHPDIWKNASEICGLASIGMVIGWDGKIKGSMPTASTGDMTMKSLNFARSLTEDGTRKLFSISLPVFIPGCDVIYVGSSPGVGWAAGAEYSQFGGRILSYDPRPLDRRVSNPQVQHKQIKVMHFTDILQD